MLEELQQTVASSFQTPRAAFKFFLKNSFGVKDAKTINYQAFQRSLESLLP